MTKDYTQQNICLKTLIEIQINATLIGVLDGDHQKVNVFFWQGRLIEIHCLRVNDQWTPVAIKYQAHTPEYEQSLIQQLNANQRIRLNTITNAHSLH